MSYRGLNFFNEDINTSWDMLLTDVNTDEMYKIIIKVSKSIGLLYKLNRFLPETILKTIYSNPSITTVNGSCMFGVLIESMLIEVKNKGD